MNDMHQRTYFLFSCFQNLRRIRDCPYHQRARLLPGHQPPEGGDPGHGARQLHTAGREHVGDRPAQVPGARGALQARPDRRGVRGAPRVPRLLHPEVGHGSEEGALPEHCPVRRIHPVQGLRRQTTRRGQEARSQRYQDPHLGAAGAALLHVDRRIHPRLARHLQEDVGVETRVRGGGA